MGPLGQWGNMNEWDGKALGQLDSGEARQWREFNQWNY